MFYCSAEVEHLVSEKFVKYGIMLMFGRAQEFTSIQNLLADYFLQHSVERFKVSCMEIFLRHCIRLSCILNAYNV